MPDAGPTAATFAQRIPVMSGMATGTIVVAANPVGTVRAHAQQAAATGRPLILLEGVLRHKWARELAESSTVTVALTSGEAVDAAA
jgi:predicted Rossmann fold nucleotide-binding protein DprA/Smf involved in DNA uptake